MDDLRVAWIASSIAAHCSRPADVDTIQQLVLTHKNSSAVSSFLDSTTLALFAFILNASDDLDLVLTNDVNVRVPASRTTLAFAKQSPSPLANGADMDANVLLCSLTANVGACLFHFIRNVYTPMLSSGPYSIGSNIQSLLTNLDAALTSEAFKSMEMTEAAEISGILMPVDEVRPAVAERPCHILCCHFYGCESSFPLHEQCVAKYLME